MTPEDDNPDPPLESPAEPRRRLTTVERAFELARTGSCRTIEEIVSQLKLEQQEAVDAHLSGTSIRKDLRQICAEQRTARVRHAEQGLAAP